MPPPSPAPRDAPLRALIFDRDGVLTRFEFADVHQMFSVEAPGTFRAMVERWERWCAKKVPPSAAEDEGAYLRSFWIDASEALGLQARTRQRLLAFDYMRAFVAYEDARPVLEAARALGLRVGVLSNFPLVSVAASLRATGLAELVDFASAAAAHGKLKPSAAAYTRVLDALGVSPAECLLLDDEWPCVDGARALGIEAYLLDRDGSVGSGDGVLRDLHAFERIFRVATAPAAFTHVSS